MSEDSNIVFGVQQFHPDDRYEVACAKVKSDGSVEQWRQDVVGFAILVHPAEDELGETRPDSSLEPMVPDEHGNVFCRSGWPWIRFPRTESSVVGKSHESTWRPRLARSRRESPTSGCLGRTSRLALRLRDGHKVRAAGGTCGKGDGE